MSVSQVAKTRQGEDGIITHSPFPRPGARRIVFGEGITSKFSEKTGHFYMLIPLQVADSDKECPGGKWSVFVDANPENKIRAENTLADLLGPIGFADKFDKFLADSGLDPETPVPDDEAKLTKIVNALNIQLPGKAFESVLEVERSESGEGEDKKTYTNVYMRKIGPLGCGLVSDGDATRGSNNAQTASPDPVTSAGSTPSW